jgi:hypothetical protein
MESISISPIVESDPLNEKWSAIFGSDTYTNITISYKLNSEFQSLTTLHSIQIKSPSHVKKLIYPNLVSINSISDEVNIEELKPCVYSDLSRMYNCYGAATYTVSDMSSKQYLIFSETSGFKINYLAQPSRTYTTRLEGEVENLGDQPPPLIDASQSNADSMRARKSRDIGQTTHNILVGLTLVAFVGNAMFMVFVFWLTR